MSQPLLLIPIFLYRGNLILVLFHLRCVPFVGEFLEHFFICCRYTKDFWAEVLKWFDNQGVKIEHLSDKDIMFGILRSEDELFINHTLIIAKQYLYSCRQNKSL